MERAIELFAAVNFFVIGLSHILQRDAWVDFFAKLHSLGRLGALAEGFLYLNMGSLIVALHNVWTFPEMVLTIIGWIFILKAIQRFVAPRTVLRAYAKMTSERAWLFQVAGGLFVALSVLLVYLAFKNNSSIARPDIIQRSSCKLNANIAFIKTHSVACFSNCRRSP